MKTLIASVLLLSVLRVPALSENLEQILARIELKEQQIKTIQFKYNQTLNYTGLDAPSSISGEAILKKPNMMRVTKHDDKDQVTVTNGKKIWIYNPAYQQVWVGQAAQWMKTTGIPAGMLTLGRFIEELKSSYDLQLVGEASLPGKNIVIKAVPKEINVGYHLTLIVSGENWMPVETILESSTARISTQFSEIKENPALVDSLFNFSPPRGTEIIALN